MASVGLTELGAKPSCQEELFATGLESFREICQSVLPRSESRGGRLVLPFMSRDQEHCISWK